jgi:hypothetical protein
LEQQFPNRIAWTILGCQLQDHLLQQFLIGQTMLYELAETVAELVVASLADAQDHVATGHPERRFATGLKLGRLTARVGQQLGGVRFGTIQNLHRLNTSIRNQAIGLGFTLGHAFIAEFVQ